MVSRGRHTMVAGIFPLPPGAGSASARWVGEEVAPGCSRGRPGVEHFVEALASALGECPPERPVARRSECVVRWGEE